MLLANMDSKIENLEVLKQRVMQAAKAIANGRGNCSLADAMKRSASRRIMLD